ncbi:MAG TPA: DMT family transporter [Terriglobales bacterium]|nr:DMT family transporter [Terriglobales bacterium]
MSRSLKAHLLLVFITFAWGATFVVIKEALAQVSPLVFNALRMTVALIALIIILHKPLKSMTRPAALGGLLVGVFLWLGYAFQTTGLHLTTPSKSAFITGLSVVLVPIIVAVSGRRVPNRWTLLGVVCAFFGLYLMTIPANEYFSLASINRGDLLTFACAVSFAFHIFTTGYMTQRHPFQQISVMQVATAAVLTTFIIPVEAPRLAWTNQVVFAVLFTGLVCTALAFTIQAWAQQFTPPTHTALIFALEPVFAALTSYVLLGERLGVRGTVGAILILGGILVSELRGSALEPDRNFETAIPSKH